MGHLVETVRRHARVNLSISLHSNVHIATHPADLPGAWAMSGKARAIRDAVEAGLVPASMLDVAAMLDAGALATRELSQLQAANVDLRARAVGLAEVYLTPKQLAALDAKRPMWRPERPLEAPEAVGVALEAPEAPEAPVERVRVKPNLHIPRAELETMTAREVGAKYGLTSGAVVNARRRSGIVCAS